MRKTSASNNPKRAARRATSTTKKRTIKKNSPQVCKENRLIPESNNNQHVPCRETKADKSIATITPWTRNHLKNNFVGVWRELTTQEKIVGVTETSWPDDIRLCRKPPSHFPQVFDEFPPTSTYYTKVIRAARNALADGVPVFEEEGPLLVSPTSLRPPKTLEERTEAILALPSEEDNKKLSRRRPLLHPSLLDPTDTLRLPSSTLLPPMVKSTSSQPETLSSPFDDPIARCTKRSRPPASRTSLRSHQEVAPPPPPCLNPRRRKSLHRPVLDLRRDIRSLRNCSVCDGSEKWFNAEFTWDDTIDEINESVFGNASFRELQREIINAVLSREDVFAMLPTGGGKSLCYQVAGLVDSGVTMVIMPLVSLMQDQYETLFALDVGVKNLSGNLTWDETRRIYDLLENRDSFKFVFVTPEKIGASESLMDLLSRLYAAGRLSRFVVDEAHCVSQWGNDFRPDYTKLRVLRDKFPDVPILALTASATIDILEDVVNRLGMRNAQVFRRSFNRPNLIYSVRLRSRSSTNTNSSAQITDAFLDTEIVPMIRNQFRDQCGIIYCFSRNNCDEVAARLRQHGIASEMYHAGMSATDREKVQRAWMAEEFHIIVATIAFGMGINKKDCRFVIHLAMPKSIEHYYQESGRAGRDGHPAHCVLFYDPKDRQKHIWLMNQGRAAGDQAERGLLEMLNFCQESIICRRKMLLEHFGESFEGKACDLPCDTCRSDIKSKYVEIPCEEEVAKVMEIMSVLQTTTFGNCPRLTLNDVKSLLMGVKFKKQTAIQDKLIKLQAVGFLKNRGFTTEDTVRLLNKMITCKILSERVVSLPHNGSAVYLNLGPNAWDSRRLIPTFSIARSDYDSKKSIDSHDDTTTTEGVSTVESMEGGRSQLEINNTLTRDLRDLLYSELVALRKKLTAQFGLHNAGSIINLTGLRMLAEYTPTDLESLRELRIPNFTSKTKIEKYGFVFTHHIMLFLERASPQVTTSSPQVTTRISRGDSFCSAHSNNVEWIDLDEIE